MEAKALTTQDLTTDHRARPMDAALDEVALRAAADPAGPPDDLPSELVTTDEPHALGPDFDTFGIAEPIRAALAAAGIKNAFPIQALTLPIALGQHDVI